MSFYARALRNPLPAEAGRVPWSTSLSMVNPEIFYTVDTIWQLLGNVKSASAWVYIAPGVDGPSSFVAMKSSV